MADDILKLTIDRNEVCIPIEHILYAVVTDKLCTIHLTDQTSVSLFLTLSTLLDALPADQFLQISRSCVIALSHLLFIERQYIILSDHTRLKYSQSRLSNILYTLRQFFANRSRIITESFQIVDLEEEFKSFANCPIPFFVVEVISEDMDCPGNFIFRYANEALASQARTTRNMIINLPASSILYEKKSTYLPAFISAALHGQKNSFYDYGVRSDKLLYVTCYQPFHGYCACFMVPIEDK